MRNADNRSWFLNWNKSTEEKVNFALPQFICRLFNDILMRLVLDLALSKSNVFIENITLL